MEGFGVHTFRFVNARGASTFVKFHWKPKQGMQSVLWDEAVKINGADPDFHRRDLWDAIEQGDFPEWELGVQRFDDDFAGAGDPGQGEGVRRGLPNPAVVGPSRVRAELTPSRS